MKIYNQEKTMELENPDLTLGQLKTDYITVKIPEVKAVEKKVRYEVLKEYPNGGKDLNEIVEVEGVEYQPEKEEKEEIQIYIPYTESQIKENRISELKLQLSETDYKVIKNSEAKDAGQSFPYDPVSLYNERQKIREEISRLGS